MSHLQQQQPNPREPSRRTRGLNPLPNPTSSSEPLSNTIQPNDTTQISGSPSLSPAVSIVPAQSSSTADNITTMSIDSHPHNANLSQITHSTTNSIPNEQYSFPHVSDASSSQYNSALYPPDQRNPYLQNNFPPLSKSSTQHQLPSSMSTISSHSVPHSIPFPHPFNPYSNPVHTTLPNAENQILTELRLTIDNLNNIIVNLRQDLQNVRQDLHTSKQQNHHLQQQLLNLAHSNHTLKSPSVPPIIATEVQTIPANEMIRTSPSISPPPIPVQPTTTQHSTTHHDPMVAAFLSNQQTFMSNQERLISHILQHDNKKVKKPPSSSDFPVLTNKQTTRDDFNDWYSKVISILATEDWLPLYDKPNMDVIPDGTLHPVLNNHLYSVLINKAKEKPQRLIRNLQYLWSDGVALLHELKRVYYGRLTRIEVRELHSQLLCSTWSRSPTEDIDTYAARTMQVRRDLKDHGIIIPPDQIKECFIMGLGPDFTEIQKDLQ